MTTCTGHRHFTGGGPLDGQVEHLEWVCAAEFPPVLTREMPGGRRYRYWRDPALREAEATYRYSGEEGRVSAR